MDGVGNGKKSKDSQMVGDYGVEEWKDGGKCSICRFLNFEFNCTISLAI